MGEAVTAVIIIATFLLVTTFSFMTLMRMWTDHSVAVDAASVRQTEQLETSISINGSVTAMTANCSTYTGPYIASLSNGGETSIADFTEMDTVVDYLNAADAPIAVRLTHGTDWSVASLTPDSRDPNTWNPDETAAISFNLPSAVKPNNRGTVVFAAPNGISDQAYFQCVSTDYYLQNNPTPPTGATNAQSPLTLGPTVPAASTLFNYDQDRNAAAGLRIILGGSGPGEADATKQQVWRTGALLGDLTISALRVDFWSGIENFTLATTGSATFYFRDYDGSSYTEIGSVNVYDTDWQGGTSNFVQKDISLTGLSYTVSSGNQLELEAVVDSASAANMWFAYDTIAYPSILQVTP